MKSQLDAAIDGLIEAVTSRQSRLGTWQFCFETGPMTDAYMVMLFQALWPDQDDLVKPLSERIARLQQPNGAWKLYRDEPEGNLSATVESYIALRMSAWRKAEDDGMTKAEQFILRNGGIPRVGLSTKVMSAIYRGIEWPSYAVPLEMVTVPTWFPLNFFDFVGYARVHIASVLIAANARYQLSGSYIPDLRHLVQETQQRRSKGFTMRTAVKAVLPMLRWLRAFKPSDLTILEAKRFLLERVEADGTMLSYASSTFYWIYALLALGYPKEHPLIQEAVKGLKTLVYQGESFTHLQNSTSTVWDTALLTYVLQEAGVPPAHPAVKRGVDYLLSVQHREPADWKIHNPEGTPGGWGFSHNNTKNPDLDDTAAALRAIHGMHNEDLKTQRAWSRGVDWILSMQNRDGGWSAFEKNTAKPSLAALGIDGARGTVVDASSADITGRMIEFLCNYAGMTTSNPEVQKAVAWLLRNQEADGSWFGRWGICYIYGTWAALTGLVASGLSCRHPTIQRGIDFLISVQNPDGGWGESCRSDGVGAYVPLHHSTLSQTAWAVDALTAALPKSHDVIRGGVQYLLNHLSDTGWETSYPTGAGLPGGFYIHYHSYRYIWPMLALSHVRRKFQRDLFQ